MYVIRKGNLYVAKPGQHNSYTKNIKNAQKFDTKEQAAQNKCGNETVTRLSTGDYI